MRATSLTVAILVTTATLLCDHASCSLHRLASKNSRLTEYNELDKGKKAPRRSNVSAIFNHIESPACLGFLVGASTAIGEVYAWHYLHGLLPQLYGAETRDMGFWDYSKGRYRGCILGDYLVLLNSSAARQMFQADQSSSGSRLCSSKKRVTASSFTRLPTGLVRSHFCQESQGRQHVALFPHSNDETRRAGRQVTALQPFFNSRSNSSITPAVGLQTTYVEDFSSTYLFSTVAPHRIKQQLPEARILVILTEPVTHVITQFNRLWWQQHQPQRVPGGTMLLLDEEQQRHWVSALTEVTTQQMHRYESCQANKRAEASFMTDNLCSKPSMRPGKRQHQLEWQVVQQAVYADSLAWWLQLFPSEQLLVWTSEGIAAQPEEHMRHLTAWLGLSSSSMNPATLIQRQAQLQLEVDELMKVVAQPPQHLLGDMQHFYKQHNDQLFRLLEDKGFGDTAAQMRRVWASRQPWSILSGPRAAAPPAPAIITPDPEPQQPSCQMVTDIDPGQVLLRIPQSFLGISHEWRHVQTINSIAGYKNMLRLLSSFGSGPLSIRVGGGSTDQQDTVPSASVFDALRHVHEETGVQYILGLNFQKGDMELARAQWESAKAQLPPAAILTFEIGNEDWSQFAHRLSCPCSHEQCCRQRLFAGPAWGHINVFPSTIKWFLESSHDHINLTTIHWYKATKEAYNTPVTLLDEAPIRKEMANLKKLVEISNSFNKSLRIAEMNSISNSGKNGVSNVFAAALWTLDALFEVAAAGAVGVNLHQGAGQNHYTALLRTYHKQNQTLAPVSLRPPFYGMVMFQQAVGSGSYMLMHNSVQASNTTHDCRRKIWPLLDERNGTLRLVLLNKHATIADSQIFCISSLLAQKYAVRAKITRLLAKGADPLSAKGGITLGGHVFGYGGRLQGREQTD